MKSCMKLSKFTFYLLIAAILTLSVINIYQSRVIDHQQKLIRVLWNDLVAGNNIL